MIAMKNYCNYCWREADKTTTENHEKVHWCAYHFLEIAAADSSEHEFAEKMGYTSAKYVRNEYENQEEPKLEAKEVISLVNELTDPRGGSSAPEKDAVVYSRELKNKIAEKAQEQIS